MNRNIAIEAPEDNEIALAAVVNEMATDPPDYAGFEVDDGIESRRVPLEQGEEDQRKDSQSQAHSLSGPRRRSLAFLNPQL